jgi:hypothetical protein
MTAAAASKVGPPVRGRESIVRWRRMSLEKCVIVNRTRRTCYFSAGVRMRLR